MLQHPQETSGLIGRGVELQMRVKRWKVVMMEGGEGVGGEGVSQSDQTYCKEGFVLQGFT